jgi:hypothetical protein
LVLASLLLTVPSVAPANPPPAEGEQLPAPQVVPVLVPEPPFDGPVFHIPQRVNRYEVWQSYGVDAQGRFRPRVIYSPYQPYYYFNGKPYGYTPVHPRWIMPSVVD